MIPIEDRTYIAGFIDADGSIMIERRKDKKSYFKYFHTPRITAVSITKEVLEYISSLYGGNVNTVKRKKKRFKTEQTTYAWSISGKRAIKMARDIMPYLKIKGVQAYIVSCFEYEAKWVKRGGLPEHARMPITEFNRREDLYREIRTSNRSSDIVSLRIN